ncbi:MAG: TIGR04551 family protein [Polyangiaceae bacterium]|nr:TIGR04551 family protein [Polyangiaceae bacterium]
MKLLRTAAFACATLTPATAVASGLTDHGTDLQAPPSFIELSGYFRMRGSLFYNLDLDRGPTPSGEIFFPVSLSDPTAQLLTAADTRIRTDVHLYAPWGGMALKVRLDALDNVLLGSMPEGVPSASTSQRADQPLFRLRRAYAEILTPFGLLSFGRMGNQWGLGMFANGGDCLDCDGGDSADRIAFVAPLLDHLWAVAYDFTASGPPVRDRGDFRWIDVEPKAIVHSFTFAVTKWRGPEARARRNAAGKVTPEYGAFASYRFQDADVPATYLPVAQPIPLEPGQVMARGFEAVAADLWLRFEGKNFRAEAEGTYLHASVEQPSLIPGVLYREPVLSNQFGAALETEFRDDTYRLRGGLDAGFASGDAAPGFGAIVPPGELPGVAGDLDGPQANPPFDREVNNFRFHPDYRVDRILFREIIGTVTDAVYVKPHVQYDLVTGIRGKLTVGLAGVLSFAAVPESAPGQASLLGFEIDPTITYASDFGFRADLEQATLIPFAGLDNVELGLFAKPAQLWRLRLSYTYRGP